MIEFLLNQTPVQLDAVAPNMNVLDWLRTRNGLMGTKEGCSSGDCGACTVAVGEWMDGHIHYRTMNACLLLVGNLHGRHLITVDTLTDAKELTVDQLHPAQRALAECHGTQCGFCTPGFIMSMFVLYRNEPKYPGKKKIIDALGGNLCRCTGYRPILEACEQMYQYPRSDDPFRQAAEAFFVQRPKQTPSLKYNGQNFYLPQSLADLLVLKARFPGARLIAGGTDLSLEFTQALKSFQVIISVIDVAEMQQFNCTGAGITIGAATRYADFVPGFVEHYPEAAEMLHRLGSAQIRNAGTLGGSLGNASPIGDPAPLLIALNATVVLASVNGERSLPVEAFFLDYRKIDIQPDEVIVRVEIPPRAEQLTLACYKISKRMEDDISAVLLAIAFEQIEGRMINVRTGFGGMAATPVRALQLEASLNGQPFTEQTLQTAAALIPAELKPMTDVRASRHYRLQVCQNLLQRLWLERSTDTIARVSHAAL
ncbi:MAG: xanthine dehydrogenase small subunit [Reinekea sp.]